MPANPRGANQVGLVTGLYETILGREPETSGLDFWLVRLNNGTSPAHVASQIFNSAEAVADRAASPPPAAPSTASEVLLVTSLYQTILGRTPDPAGLDAFLADLGGSTSPADVASRIFNSAEAVADRGSSSPTTVSGRVAFVTSLYRSILGRAPEASGDAL